MGAASQLYRLRIPVALTFIFGIVIVISQIVDRTAGAWLVAEAGRLQSWVLVVSTFMASATILRTFLSWLSAVQTQGFNYKYFAISAVAFVIRATVGFIYGITHYWSTWFIAYILTPMEQGVWAFNGYFYWSTAWRAFKLRSPEVAILFVCMVVQTLMVAPIGQVAFPWISDVGNWLQRGIVRGGERAMLLTTAIAGVILGIRTLVGMERGYLAGARRRPEAAAA
jgi:hypothetical protein